MNNKNNKKNNLNLKFIIKFLRSEKGKRYSFIIFYFFFFIFLFIFLNANKVVNNEQEEFSLPFKTMILENNDYKFKYIIKSNYDELLYLGTKTTNNISIMDDTGVYNYNYKNGRLINIDNKNIKYYQLFDIYEIKRLIKNSKLISETKLNETGEYIFNYKITNKDLNNILNNNINNLEKDNEIIIKTNNKKELKNINLNLLNYEKELSNLTEFNITIEYGDLSE